MTAPAATAHGADALVAETPSALATIRAYHTLDALRGVAALVVLMFHAAFFFGVAPPAEGYLAVDLFFAMSGFVIAYRYDGDLARGLGFRAFLGLRLSRLYPLFLLGTVLGALPALLALASGHVDHLHKALAASLPLDALMLPSRLAADARPEVYPLDYVSWSLALELLVNLAYAATYRVWSLRNLVLLLAAAFAGLCVAAAVYGSLNVGFDWANALGGVPRAVWGFGCGVLLYRLRLGAKPRMSWWLLIALVPLLLFIDPLGLGFAWARPVFDVAIVTLVVPFVVRASAAVEPPRSVRGACALAGVLSYPLYVLHTPFVALFLRLEDRLHLDLATMSPQRSLWFATGLAAVVWLAHACYDRPVRLWLSRRRHQSRVAAVHLAA